MTAVLFGMAAAAGAAGRQVIGRMEHTWQALLVANTIGSLILGIVLAADLSSEAEVILGVGLCGSFTTFSSFADELRRLGWRNGTAYATVTALLTSGAIALTTTLI